LGCQAVCSQLLDAVGESRQRQQRGERERDGQLQQQQRLERVSRGGGSCLDTSGEAYTQ